MPPHSVEPPSAGGGTAASPLAGLRVRLLSLCYEAILLFALVFVAAYLFISLARDAQGGWARLAFQLYLLAVCGAYFMFCWVRSGQTLPMKTWRLQLRTLDGRPLSAGTAMLRYLVAVPAMCTGLGILWAVLDRDRQFLQDRIAGTRIVRLGAPSPRAAG